MRPVGKYKIWMQAQDAAPRDIAQNSFWPLLHLGLLFPGTDSRQLRMNQTRVGICRKSPFQAGIKKVRTQITDNSPKDSSQKEL